MTFEKYQSIREIINTEKIRYIMSSLRGVSVAQLQVSAQNLRSTSICADKTSENGVSELYAARLLLHLVELHMLLLSSAGSTEP